MIGGGNSGVEAAIDLAGVVAHVTLIEFADQLKADAVLVNKLKSLPNVTIHTNAQTTEITGADGKVNGLKYKDRATGEEHLVPLEGVFVQIGLVPNTEWLKGTVELSKFGEIVIDAQGPHQRARRVCRRRLHHGALQADRDCRRVRCHSRLSAFDHLIRTPVVAEGTKAQAAQPRQLLLDAAGVRGADAALVPAGGAACRPSILQSPLNRSGRSALFVGVLQTSLKSGRSCAACC